MERICRAGDADARQRGRAHAHVGSARDGRPMRWPERRERWVRRRARRAGRRGERRTALSLSGVRPGFTGAMC
jgi:hypothetical protein